MFHVETILWAFIDLIILDCLSILNYVILFYYFINPFFFVGAFTDRIKIIQLCFVIAGNSIWPVGECWKKTEVGACLFGSLVVFWFFCFIWTCNLIIYKYFLSLCAESQMLLLWLSSFRFYCLIASKKWQWSGPGRPWMKVHQIK
jgi:hypothetical protein